jgi:hypothetical protein
MICSPPYLVNSIIYLQASVKSSQEMKIDHE